MEYGKRYSGDTPGEGNAGLVESAQLAFMAALAADEKKGREVRMLDIRSISSVTDYFVIVSGTSTTHVRSLADNVEKVLQEAGLPLHHMEGYRNGRWVLLDFGDIVIHVMHEDERKFYNLERLWGDAQEITIPRSEAV